MRKCLSLSCVCLVIHLAIIIACNAAFSLKPISMIQTGLPHHKRRGSAMRNIFLLNVLSDRESKTQEKEENNGTESSSTSSYPYFGDNIIDFVTETDSIRQYYWQEFLPRGGGILKKIRWLITGDTIYAKQTEEQTKRNLASLARMLLLLREYEARFGIPDFGNPQQQREVLSNITKDLYNSGAPTWVLETVMERVAEGITGKEGIHLMLLPNRCFIFYPPSVTSSNSKNPGTDMLKISPGFNIAKLGAVEQVAVRLASFASNTRSVERLNSSSLRMPSKKELDEVQKQETESVATYFDQTDIEAGALAKEILNLASSTYGLFFFVNNKRLQIAIDDATDDKNQFWEVDETTQDLFMRLAANEAIESMEKIRSTEEKQQLYTPFEFHIFRILSSAGACAMWFGGSVSDMIVSGALAVTVAHIGTSKALAFEERVLTEVVSSFFVGLCAGLLAIQWPNRFCFGAIAVASVMDLLQGFKVVYAVIEVMSKNIVTGAARLLEGIMFTGLISYSLKFGLDFAFRIKFGGIAPLPLDYSNMLVATHSISEKFFPLILPFAVAGWSSLFRPSHGDIPLMMFHGILGFTLSWAGVPMFLAAAWITFSAGLISRFTGREALGNTLAGLYALVPGTYMIRALLLPTRAGFIESVLFAATAIGLGGWTGTILCSPTILGKSSGLHGGSSSRGERKKKQEAMLFF